MLNVRDHTRRRTRGSVRDVLWGFGNLLASREGLLFQIQWERDRVQFRRHREGAPPRWLFCCTCFL